MPDTITGNALISTWFDDRQSQMMALLEELVNTDSGSRDKEGVDVTGKIVQRFLHAAGVETKTIANPDYGDVLVATVPPCDPPLNQRPILLMGHRDTVFPNGEATRRPFHIKNGRAYGPGVNDMKSGITINAYVMAAFLEQGGLPMPLVGLFTGDEEIGSPFSRGVIEDHARNAAAVFNAEPARPSGNIVTGRKGGVFMLVEVYGKAAHSGVNFFEGASAINELADKILRLRLITDVATGTTLNVGLIRGGQTVNSIAPYAAAELDLRYVSASDRHKAMEAIRSIVSQCDVPGTTSSLSIQGEFLPLESSEASDELFRLYRLAGADIGVHVEGEFTGGCADSGFAASQGIPTLCSVGAVGGKSHTPDEYIEVSSLVERAKVLAIAISRLAYLGGVSGHFHMRAGRQG